MSAATWQATWHPQSPDPALVITQGDAKCPWFGHHKILLLTAAPSGLLVWLWWNRQHGTWHPLDPRYAEGWYQYSPCTWSKEPQ